MGTGRAHAGLQTQVSEFERFADLADAMGVEGIRVTAVRIAGSADSRAVHMFFRYARFADVLFAYRSMRADADPHERVWLAEEIATGALHRIMRSEQPVADRDGVVWLHLSGQRLVAGPMASDARPVKRESTR
jgi:hypothetical protein